MKREKYKIIVVIVIAVIAFSVTFKFMELRYHDLPIGLSVKEKLLFCWNQPFNKYSAFCIGSYSVFASAVLYCYISIKKYILIKRNNEHK